MPGRGSTPRRVKLNGAAAQWLADACGADPVGPGRLPQAVHAVVGQLRAVKSDPLSAAAPRLRVRGRSGRWLTALAESGCPQLPRLLDAHGRR